MAASNLKAITMTDAPKPTSTQPKAAGLSYGGSPSESKFIVEDSKKNSQPKGGLGKRVQAPLLGKEEKGEAGLPIPRN